MHGDVCQLPCSLSFICLLQMKGSLHTSGAYGLDQILAIYCHVLAIYCVETIRTHEPTCRHNASRSLFALPSHAMILAFAGGAATTKAKVTSGGTLGAPVEDI